METSHRPWKSKASGRKLQCPLEWGEMKVGAKYQSIVIPVVSKQVFLFTLDLTPWGLEKEGATVQLNLEMTTWRSGGCSFTVYYLFTFFFFVCIFFLHQNTANNEGGYTQVKVKTFAQRSRIQWREGERGGVVVGYVKLKKRQVGEHRRKKEWGRRKKEEKEGGRKKEQKNKSLGS